MDLVIKIKVDIGVLYTFQFFKIPGRIFSWLTKTRIFWALPDKLAYF